jgi:hypothetical protein
MFLAGKWATVMGPGSFPEMWLSRRRIGNPDFMRLMVSPLKYVFDWVKQGQIVDSICKPPEVATWHRAGTVLSLLCVG